MGRVRRVCGIVHRQHIHIPSCAGVLRRRRYCGERCLELGYGGCGLDCGWGVGAVHIVSGRLRRPSGHTQGAVRMVPQGGGLDEALREPDHFYLRAHIHAGGYGGDYSRGAAFPLLEISSGDVFGVSAEDAYRMLSCSSWFSDIAVAEGIVGQRAVVGLGADRNRHCAYYCGRGIALAEAAESRKASRSAGSRLGIYD